MADLEDVTDRGEWQVKLEQEIMSQGVDSSLLAAIINEPGQTYDGARAILKALLSVNDVDARADASKSAEPCGTTESEASNSKTPSIEDESIDQLIQEWRLIDVQSNLTENLNVTDEEEENDETLELKTKKEKESARIGEAASQNLIDIKKVAAGEEGIAALDAKAEIDLNYNNDGSGLAFLVHAFPSRTPIFLQEILKDERGNVESTIDTLTVMEMAENGHWEESETDAEPQPRRTKPGLDYDLLEKGTASRKASKNQRKRRKERHNFDDAIVDPGKERPQTIHLTDIRRGGPSITRLPKREIIDHQHRPQSHSAPSEKDDAAMAARLDLEERKAAGLSSSGEGLVIQDNDWLFSSSILDQLSSILDISSHKVRAVHNTCQFNLRATTQRLINLNCEDYSSLCSLDEAGDLPNGTASKTVEGLTLLMPKMTRKEVERLFRGSKGRQDATLDLVQLIDLVEKSAIGEKTDVLDPMKASRTRPNITSQIKGTTVQVSNGKGHFDFVGDNIDPFPQSGLDYSLVTKRSSRKATQTESRKYALEQLRAGAASTAFPFHSAHTQANSSGAISHSNIIDGPRRHESQSEAERMSREFRAIADEYRNRREEKLRQAASAYRSLPGGGASKQVRGAAAWVYADEARHLDAKARAFSLKSAQALIRHRMMMNRSEPSYTSNYISRQSSDVVDLHGLTVHESLSITKEALSAWWSKSSSGNIHPLYIVTGVGRHSRGHIAMIRPAILKMLHGDGWIAEERREGQITVKGLR